MPLTIRRLTGGPIETNAFLVANTTTGDAIVIDAPGDITAEVVATAQDLGVTINQIVVTHGHWDHIQDLAALHEATGAPVAGSPRLRARIESPEPYAGPVHIAPATLDEDLNEGDTVNVGGHSFTVMEMPGHDEAHIILCNEDDRVIFGGDVLFPGGHGRTDVPGSDQRAMNRSLRRFLDLPDDVRVFPGHGDHTTIGAERGWIARIPGDR